MLQVFVNVERKLYFKDSFPKFIKKFELLELFCIFHDKNIYINDSLKCIHLWINNLLRWFNEMYNRLNVIHNWFHNIIWSIQYGLFLIQKYIFLIQWNILLIHQYIFLNQSDILLIRGEKMSKGSIYFDPSIKYIVDSIEFKFDSII